MPNSGGTEVRSFPERSRRINWRNREISGGMNEIELWLRYRTVRYEKRNRFRDKFFKRIPPRSRVVHVDSCCLRMFNGFSLCAGASEDVEAEGVCPFTGRSAIETADDEPGEACLSDRGEPVASEAVSGGSCDIGGCSLALGLVIGMGALAEFRVAIADARAR